MQQALSNIWASTGGKVAIFLSISGLGICMCCGSFLMFAAALPETDTVANDSANTPSAAITNSATETSSLIATSQIEVPPTVITQAIIPGLNPADITVNLEQRGLTCAPVEEWAVYYFRSCKGSEGDLVDIEVSIFGKQLFEVDYISASVYQYHSTPEPAIAAPFLGYMATLPYDGATPEVARMWVESTLPSITLEESGANKFGDVYYRLLGPPFAYTLAIGFIEGDPPQP